MSKHNETGLKGEQLAENFLLSKGYRLLHRNWCHGKKEIDLVMQKDDVLVFVEVKTRSSLKFSFPEEAVDARKQGYLREAAGAFMDEHPQFFKVQFDVVSVHLKNETAGDIVHFEDAFY